jgi:hypothetical protein
MKCVRASEASSSIITRLAKNSVQLTTFDENNGLGFFVIVTEVIVMK